MALSGTASLALERSEGANVVSESVSQGACIVQHFIVHGKQFALSAALPASFQKAAFSRQKHSALRDMMGCALSPFFLPNSGTEAAAHVIISAAAGK